MDFNSWLRSMGFDPEKLDDETKARMRKMYDENSKLRAAASSAEKGAEESVSRINNIMSLARCIVATATSDAVRSNILEYANELATNKDISLSDAGNKLNEKVREIVGDGIINQVLAGPVRRTYAVVGTSDDMSRADIVAAFGDNDSRMLHKKAAEACIRHMKSGDTLEMDDLAKDLEGKKGKLRYLDSRNMVRVMTAPASAVAYQAIQTLMLNKNYNEQNDDTAELVSVIPSSASEDVFPEVEGEDGVRYIKEGEAYPIMGASGQYVKVGHKKAGVAIAQTREKSIFDKYGELNVSLNSASRQLHRNRSNHRIHRIVDSTTFDGKHVCFPGSSDGANALYATSEDERGNYNLVVSNPLSGKANLTAVRKLLAMRKLKDGTFVNTPMANMLVPVELYEVAWELLNSIFVPPTSATNTQTYTPNFYGPNGGQSVKTKVFSHPLLDSISISDWYAGEFAAQFYEKEIWGPEVMPKLTDGEMSLRDINALWIASYCIEVAALTNMYVVKSQAGA